MENVLLYTRSGHKVLGSLLGSKPYDAVALAAAVALYLCLIAFIRVFLHYLFSASYSKARGTAYINFKKKT